MVHDFPGHRPARAEMRVVFLASGRAQPRAFRHWAVALGERADCHVLASAEADPVDGADAPRYARDLLGLPPFRPTALFAAHTQAAAAVALCRRAEALGLDHLVVANAAPPHGTVDLRLPITVLLTDERPGSGRAHAPAWRHCTTGRTELRLLECRDEDLYAPDSPAVAALREALRIAPGFGDHIT